MSALTKSIGPLPLIAMGAAGIIAVLVILLTLVPGTDISLVWPSEYIILLAWFLLGAVIYIIVPREPDERALEALLGDQYARVAAEREGYTAGDRAL